MIETSDTLLGAQFFRGGQALDSSRCCSEPLETVFTSAIFGWLAFSGAVFTQKCKKMLMRRDPVSATFGNPELSKYSSKVSKPCKHTQPPGRQSTAEDFGRDSTQTQWTSSRDVQRVAA